MKKIILIIIIFLVLVLSTAGVLLHCGVIWFNNPSIEEYPVRGVDVSSYQGIIDWEKLATQNISFAFIKATEGSSYIDPYYYNNYENALKTDIKIGSYHFFSFESSGEKQAENFISVCAKTKNMLPPVVDIEYYGDYNGKSPDVNLVQSNLKELIEKLENHYGVKPIIYATQRSYKKYISGSFLEYDVWIRDVYTKASLNDGRDWTFWQYSHKGKLAGYDGEEKFIDMNVFNGTKEEFDDYMEQ
ncbi:MAG TPA: glycoside hydrolase family 25 [Clostridiales bacterium]|nr:GH25 family lysozyme [Eubacteriales bacterium]HBR32504.1 glycoside hydrolase family 25 [Clostridiales bacterium]